MEKEKELTLEQLPKAVFQLSEQLRKIEGLILNQFNPQPTKQPDKLLNVPQAAEFLSLAIPTVYSMVSRGEIPVMKRSKRLYFSTVELTDYLKQGRKKTNSEVEAEAVHLLNRKTGRN